MPKKEIKPEYRRKLPHIQPKDGIFFVTFRLKGTLPKSIIEEYNASIENEKNKKVKIEKSKEYFTDIEEILDKEKTGPKWLKDENIATVVKNSLVYLNKNNICKIICYCIMSNHVHFIAKELTEPLYAIMHSIKSYSANECNKLLGRTGRFWQREYFDYVMRNENDLSEKIKYVLNNPVKAGLVQNWRDWDFSYCDQEFLEM